MSDGSPRGASRNIADPLTLIWASCGAVLVGLSIEATVVSRAERIAEVFFYLQDLPALGAAALFWIVARFAPGFGLQPPATTTRARAIALGGAAFAVAAAFIGARLVYQGYALSMDEFMAGFDAAIFQHGYLAAPLDAVWRPFARPLQPIFALPVRGTAFWTSNYLPVNAAFRAVFGALGAPALTNALWAGVAVLATFGTARKLWPARPDAAAVAVLLLVTSTQFLIAAMSPYAMTAHLALNMLWLWLFMQRKAAFDLAGVAIAFLATGLHQLIFHPLFAAPFVLHLWLSRQWRRAALITLAYLAICLFWASYWRLAYGVLGVPPAAAEAVGGGLLVDRVAALLAAFEPGGLGVMAKNLARFVAWQNPLAIALAGLGLASAVRAGGVLRALVAGFALTLVVMFIVLAFQGHGWGYRYVHGFLGGVSLVAAHAWVTRVAPDPAQTAPRARWLLSASIVFVLAVLLPLQAYQAYAWIRPYAEASRRIAAAPADIVFVDARGLWYGADLVRNDPFLRNRPKVMALGSLSEAQVAFLCQRYRIAVFDRASEAARGIRFTRNNARLEAHLIALRQQMRRMGCGAGGVAP
jgi:hypothetical protein